MNIITIIIVGLIAGWLGSAIMNKKKGSIITYIVIGVVGAFIGGFIFSALEIATHGLIGEIIAATIGAICLIYILKLLKI